MTHLNHSRNAEARPRAASSVRLLSLVVCCTLACLSTRAATLYVWQDSPSPGPLYGDWSSAAHTVQDAVDVAQAGDLVLVTNGVYASGGRAVGTNLLVNRVVVEKPITLQSVNGSQVTIIQGYQVPGSRNGDGAIRCVHLTNGATLSGFTLTNGATRLEGDYYLEQNGGGLWCETNAAVTNCVLTGNSASSGGGAYGGTLNNCTLTGNGASFGFGGGADECTLNNCTLTGNSAAHSGGVFLSSLKNCILYYNTANTDPNYSEETLPLNYCCTTPLPGSGTGNITNAPLFVDTNGWANLRLQSNSPCINAGDNTYLTTTTDLDGNPRIVSGTVDIDAYEYQGAGSVISYAWLQQYGLLTDGSADFTDPDGDGVNNYHEWLAGTNPTNRFSSPAQLTIIPSGINIIVMWPTNADGFTLQSTTNLGSLAVWVTNSPAPVVIGAQNTVTNPISGAPQFYRLSQ